MDLTTLVKTATVISTGCSVVMVGIAAYSAKKQAELNRIIHDGTQRMITDTAEIKSFMYAAQK